jgi:DNA-binding CsgD family transcriptional regulator
MFLASAWPVGGNLPFELKPGEYTIGRVKKADILICDSSVSRAHAKLLVGSDWSMRIEDLRSRGGIDINGESLSSSRVHAGDRLRIGAVPCLILLKPVPPAPLDEESDSSAAAVAVRPKRNKVRIDDLLSPCQREVLRFLARGMSESEIATQTGRSYHTVHNHVRVIYRVFNVNTRGRLLAIMNALG